MGGRAWMPEEIAVVRERYGNVSADSLASLLGRTPSAVRNLAAWIGLRTGSRVLWTTNEEKRLRQLYPKYGMIRTAVELGRTEHSVARRAADLGISGSRGQRRRSDARRAYRPWTRMEDCRLRDEYVAQGSRAVAELLDRSPMAVQLRARLLGVAKART